MYHWQVCSPILWLSFYFVDGLICCAKTLVWCSPICLFFLLFPLPREIYLIKYYYKQCPRFCCLCFLLIFMISGLTIKLLIHFEFVLVYVVRRWSSFIFLYVSIQVSQYHLLNKLSLSHCICVLPLSKINWQ